jgi:hypothetical protein
MRTLTKLLSTAGIIVILLAIWRANNGDVTVMVNTIWGIIDTAADLLTQIWNQVMAVDPLGTSGGVAPADAPAETTVP